MCNEFDKTIGNAMFVAAMTAIIGLVGFAMWVAWKVAS